METNTQQHIQSIKASACESWSQICASTKKGGRLGAYTGGAVSALLIAHYIYMRTYYPNEERYPQMSWGNTIAHPFVFAGIGGIAGGTMGFVAGTATVLRCPFQKIGGILFRGTVRIVQGATSIVYPVAKSLAGHTWSWIASPPPPKPKSKSV